MGKPDLYLRGYKSQPRHHWKLELNGEVIDIYSDIGDMEAVMSHINERMRAQYAPDLWYDRWTPDRFQGPDEVGRVQVAAYARGLKEYVWSVREDA